MQDAQKRNRPDVCHRVPINGVDSWIGGGVFPRLCLQFIVWIILLALAGITSKSEADELNLKASFEAKEEYNTNLFFDEKNRVSDWLTTLGMGIQGSRRTERIDLFLQGRASRLIYGDHSHLNGNDYYGEGRVRYSLRPTTQVYLESGMKRETRPDRDLEATGVITRAFKRDHLTVAGGVEETFTETTRAQLAGYFETYNYPRDPEWIDSKVYGANLRLDQALSRSLPNTTGRIQIGFARFETPRERTDQYFFTSGLHWRFHEKWNLLVDGGASFNRSRYRVERIEFFPPFFWTIHQETEEKKGFGWLGQAMLSYRGERTEAGLTFHRRLIPSTGKRGTTENTSFNLDLNHRFTEDLSGRFTAGYHLNKAEALLFSTIGTDERTFHLMPSIRYEWERKLTVKASYRFTQTHDRLTGSRARGNLFLIQIILNQTLFE